MKEADVGAMSASFLVGLRQRILRLRREIARSRGNPHRRLRLIPPPYRLYLTASCFRLLLYGELPSLVGVEYSHSEAERILRKDLSQLCAYYRGYGASA